MDASEMKEAMRKQMVKSVEEVEAELRAVFPHFPQGGAG